MTSLISSPRINRRQSDVSTSAIFLDTRQSQAIGEEVDHRSVIVCDNDAYFAHPLPFILTTDDLDGPGRGAD